MNYKYLFLNKFFSVLALFVILLPQAAADTTVFAAASMKNALDEVQKIWAAQNGGKVIASYAASSALARQIEKGAPADIFISADLDWMDYLSQRKLVNEGSRTNLLRNQLVMIAPAGSNATVDLKPGLKLGELLGKERLSMADPDSVPAGKYGKAALEKLGLWPQVSDRLARGENVRTALNFVARAEAPLGIVYRTDAAAESKVKIVAAFPGDSHPPIVYPAALLAASKNAEAAAFFTFMKSEAATGIFRKHGFLPY
ncbi:MAG: molybdate ABC transporter substrate-binding protein [Burkholderiales bacterium]|nr:molybdate ABC transporter substrate-binding protein [Burkholderiales bacterium]